MDPVLMMIVTFCGVFAACMAGLILYAVIGGLAGVIVGTLVASIGTNYVMRKMSALLK